MRKQGLMLALILIFIIGWSWLVYDFAAQKRLFSIASQRQQQNESDNELERLRAVNAKLRMDLAIVNRGYQIDVEAGRLARREIGALQTQLAQQKREVALLHGLLAKGKGSLYIRNLEILPLAEDRHYSIKVEIVQLLESIEQTSIELKIVFEGMQDGKKKSYTEKELRIGNKVSAGIKFHRLYRKSLLVELPKGFTPQMLRISLFPKNKRLKKVKQSFDWSESNL